MQDLSGFQNEFQFVKYLDGKCFGEVHPLFQDLLEALYGSISDDTRIHAYKYNQYAKADMIIVINGISKGISIKKGYKNSVHIEKIEKFLFFIRKSNFNEEKRLLEYLYSDGTTNNTGTNRLSTSDYKKTHSKDIEILNRSFENIILSQRLIVRFLFKTDVNYKINVDAVISGNINDFLWATREEIEKYLIKSENRKFKASGVHTSKLWIQCWDKNLTYNPRYEKCREYIQVKWFSLYDDLFNIMIDRHKKTLW